MISELCALFSDCNDCFLYQKFFITVCQGSCGSIAMHILNIIADHDLIGNFKQVIFSHLHGFRFCVFCVGSGCYNLCGILF